MLYDLLMVLVPTMPLIVSILGLSGEVVTLIHYNNNGYQQEFIRTLVLMVIPVVVLLIATITGYEKPKGNDPDVVKSSYFISCKRFSCKNVSCVPGDSWKCYK